MAKSSLNSENGVKLSGKTAIITGGAHGIGAQTARQVFHGGANVVIADLPSARKAAEELIASLSTTRVIFVSTNVLAWQDMVNLYTTAFKYFGQVDIVIANAGIMESREFFDLERDSDGHPMEPLEAFRVIDVNLKGAMNTLCLAVYYMRNNPPDPVSHHRGSIVLIASTSGYFGGTGVVSYIASKHGIVGLLRASQKTAAKFQLRINGVAPFFTPTHITGSYADRWRERGMPANRIEDVAGVIINTAVDVGMSGGCVLVKVAGQKEVEIEAARSAMVPTWIGKDIARIMTDGRAFFDEIGGYPLPKPRL